MAPLVYIMAIMGCGDDGVTCTRERIAPATYTSVAACRAAVPAVLASNTDLSWPLLTASCQRSDMQVANRTKRTSLRAG